MNMSKLENVTITSVIPDSNYISLNGNQYSMNPNLGKLFKGGQNRPSLLQAGDLVDAVLQDEVVKSLHKKAGGNPKGETKLLDKETLKQVPCDNSRMDQCMDWAVQLVSADAKTLEKDDDSYTVMRIVKIADFFYNIGNRTIDGEGWSELYDLAKKLE